MIATIQETECDLVRVEKVAYKKKSLLGIFEWYVKVSTTKMHDDIYITTTRIFDDVYVNGVKYRPVF